jgi:hypothetical protein
VVASENFRIWPEGFGNLAADYADLRNPCNPRL